MYDNQKIKQHNSLFTSNLYLSNYQSNFAHLQTNGIENNSMKTKSSSKSITIKNPLVVSLGISIYHRYVNVSLECVPMDYKNVEYAFNIVRGYDMIYYNPNNEIVLKRHKIDNSDNISNNKDCNNSGKGKSSIAIQVGSKKRYKLRWNETEIFEFNDAIYDILADSKYNYDCLLYFMSCHGDSDSVIYDSDGNKVPLITIFDKFSNQNCIRLRNKPKIYFIEACRGSMRTKRIANSNFLMINDHDNKETSKHIKNNVNNADNNSNKVSLEESVTTKAHTPAPADEKTVETNDSLNDHHKDNAISNETDDINISSNTVSNILSNGPDKPQNTYSKYNYNREIYANTEGNAVVEPGSKGAYMIRSITQSFVNNEIFKKSLDEIIIHSRKIMLKLMGMSTECGAQIIDDHNNIPNKILFK